MAPADQRPAARLSRDEARDLVVRRRALFDVASTDNPFASAEWTLHFLDQVVEEKAALLALEVEARAVWLMLERPGREGAALANYYTSLYTPITGTLADRTRFAEPLVRALIATRPATTAVRLAPLSAEAEDTAALADAFRAQGFAVRRFFAFGNWFLEPGGMSMDRYLEGRPSQLRNTLQRKSRKFDRAGGMLRIYVDQAEAEAAIDAYERVYARSWKVPEPYPNFVPQWARVCAANGWLRMGIAWLDHTPIAAQFWFVRAGRAYIFKLAYDEEHGAWSAGTLLTAALMRRCLDEDRVTEVDYLTGDDAYKSVWMSQRRERIGLYAFNLRTARGVALAGREQALALLRPLLGRARAVSPSAAAPEAP